jgi:hypothetical protein
MWNHFVGRGLMLFLLCTSACVRVGKSTQGEAPKQDEAPKQEAPPSVARPEAGMPSTMLMDLEPPPEVVSKARLDEKRPLPVEPPPEAKPGAKMPAMMLQDLEVPPNAAKAAPGRDKPMPLPQEEKPPR